MPSKSMNQIKKDKAFKTIAVCAMVFLFVASLLMAIVLPFVDTVGVAYATSANTSAENEPVYAEGVGKGTYIDFSFLDHVSIYDYNGTDLVYGFYYDVSYKFDFDFRDNTVLTGNKSYNFTFYKDASSSSPSYMFSMLNNYSSIGASNYAQLINYFPYGSSSTNVSYYLMYYSKTDKRFNLSYVLNGFYFGEPMSYVTFKEDFKTTEYAKHMYFITESFDNTMSEIANVKQQNVLLQQHNAVLQSQYNDLLNSMDFSVFNSVNLDTSPVYNTNYKGDATQITVNGTSYSGYWYRRRNVESGERRCLTELNIGSTLLAGSEIKCTYDALYKYNGEVPEDIYVGLAFTEYGISGQYDESHFYQMFIPYSKWFNGSFIVSVPFNVNYIAFDLFDSAFIPLSLGYNINTGLAEGLFISNFVVSGRGSNFKTAIDNAHKQGYNSGYEQGFAQGKDKGYLQGSKDQGDYTFMGLIGAVFDAPISAFQGLLNFEVLGVDMSAFVLALFSLAVIVVIVKIALGGK